MSLMDLMCKKAGVFSRPLLETETCQIIHFYFSHNTKSKSHSSSRVYEWGEGRFMDVREGIKKC